MKHFAKFLVVGGFFFFTYTSAGGNQRVGDFLNNAQCVTAAQDLALQENTLGIPGFYLVLRTQPGSASSCYQDDL